MSSSPDPTRRPRRGLGVTVGLIALLLVLTIVVPRGSTSKSTSLPSGTWGETIACLERDQDYRVTDAESEAVPGAGTRAVTVTRRVHDVELAQVRDAGTVAGARALAGRSELGSSAADAHAAGAIAWAFSEGGTPAHVLANAGDRTLIDFCVEQPGRAARR